MRVRTLNCAGIEMIQFHGREDMKLVHTAGLVDEQVLRIDAIFASEIECNASLISDMHVCEISPIRKYSSSESNTYQARFGKLVGKVSHEDGT